MFESGNGNRLRPSPQSRPAWERGHDMARIIILLAMTFLLLGANPAAAQDFNTPLGPSELSNMADILQNGDQLTVTVSQEGTALQALVNQTGLLNNVAITQNGDHILASVIQSNTGNLATINQRGSYLTAYVTQTGSNNTAFTNQTGSYQYSAIVQSGNGNFASVFQAN